MKMKLVIGLIILFAALGKASAKIVEIPYEQFVAGMLDSINRIPSMKTLNNDEKYKVRGDAALLFYAFVCRGPLADAQDRLHSLLMYRTDLRSSGDEATMAAIGLLVIQGTSHPLDGYTCRFAKGLAGI